MRTMRKAVNSNSKKALKLILRRNRNEAIPMGTEEKYIGRLSSSIA